MSSSKKTIKGLEGRVELLERQIRELAKDTGVIITVSSEEAIIHAVPDPDLFLPSHVQAARAAERAAAAAVDNDVLKAAIDQESKS